MLRYDYDGLKYKHTMITVTRLPLLGQDDRGYSAEYLHGRQGKHILVFRRAGSISGRHYHKGISPVKNPETLILCTGDITLNYYPIGTEERHSAAITAPAKIEVYPNVWHELIARTDCVFIEQNSLSEHQADTFY